MPLFSSLSLAPNLLRAVEEEGYTTPTPIQAQCIPPGVEGRDLLGCAQTGTGKTAAFALPILHRLSEMPPDKTRRGPAIPRALILSPTRELATQIGESFATYGRYTSLSYAVIFGGVSQFHQVRALHRGVDILVATPGRLIDLLEQRLVILSGVSIFVLDEADRMLDMGFIQPIRRIVSALPPPPATRQTLLFSATMPKEITHLAESLMKNPVRVSVTPVASAAPLIQQSVYAVSRARKISLLQHLLRDRAVKRAVVFTRTKHGADKLCKRLSHAGFTALAIHGNKAQNARTRAIESFRSGSTRVLVATDVAARGLDIDEISHVFNFDLPVEPEAYVHRIGRTGRAGATGVAIAFCDEDERPLLRDIERLTGKRIELLRPPVDLVDADPAELHGTTSSYVSRHAYPSHGPQRPRLPDHSHRAAPHHAAPPRESREGAPPVVREPRESAAPAPAYRDAREGAPASGPSRRPPVNPDQRENPRGPRRGNEGQHAPRPYPPKHNTPAGGGDGQRGDGYRGDGGQRGDGYRSDSNRGGRGSGPGGGRGNSGPSGPRERVGTGVHQKPARSGPPSQGAPQGERDGAPSGPKPQRGWAHAGKGKPRRGR